MVGNLVLRGWHLQTTTTPTTLPGKWRSEVLQVRRASRFPQSLSLPLPLSLSPLLPAFFFVILCDCNLFVWSVSFFFRFLSPPARRTYILKPSLGVRKNQKCYLLLFRLLTVLMDRFLGEKKNKSHARELSDRMNVGFLLLFLATGFRIHSILIAVRWNSRFITFYYYDSSLRLFFIDRLKHPSNFYLLFSRFFPPSLFRSFSICPSVWFSWVNFLFLFSV